MIVWSRTFRAVKGGYRQDEYEDAARPHGDACRAGKRLRYAVADGATETSFSGSWADLLAKGFAQGRTRSITRWLEVARQSWQAQVAGLVLPWYAQAKAEEGAFAAFIGLELQESGDWHAMAAGDCCLFHYRHGELQASFPIAMSSEFNSRPTLIGSRAQGNLRDDAILHWSSGSWRPGDRFLLSSDAFAHWVLCSHERGEMPLDMLQEALFETAGFEHWVERLRAQGLQRNDDVTLLDLRVWPAGATPGGLPTLRELAHSI